MITVPVIPANKNYWLVRTQGGRYYSEYKKNGFIAIDWEEISLEDINNLTRDELEEKVRTSYPDKIKPGRAAGQLKTFVKDIKKGDTVVITSYSSNNFSVGEVLEDDCYVEIIDQNFLEENIKLCPFQKRKKVRWIKEVHKWNVEMSMFKLLQHAQNTISDANEYADVIESMIHDFYIRGEKAELTLRVEKEGKIPWDIFFSMGMEISDLAREFNEFSDNININLDLIETKININSPGRIKLAGPVFTITVIGMILVSLTGGGINVPIPKQMGGGTLDIHMNSLVKDVTEFLDHKQAREQKEMVLKKYMDHLVVHTPEELSQAMKAVEAQSSSQDSTSSVEAQTNSQENTSSDKKGK